MQQPYLRNELYLAKRPRFLTESCNWCTTAACLVRMYKGARSAGVRKLPVLLCKSGAFRRISFACRLYSCEKKIASLLRSSHDGAEAAAKTRTKFLGFTRWRKVVICGCGLPHGLPCEQSDGRKGTDFRYPCGCFISILGLSLKSSNAKLWRFLCLTKQMMLF